MYRTKKHIIKISFIRIISALVFAFFAFNVWAQSITEYTFSASGGSFTALSGATNVSSIQTDDAISALIPIGFTFTYLGVGYTDVKASSNGFLSFNTSATDITTNSLSGTATSRRPLLAPLWDDLDGALGTASYKTEGTAGTRIFTFEWLNWQWNYAASGVQISFQVKLYEETGVIDFIYRQEAGTVNSGSASIGITSSSTGAGNYWSLNNTSASPTPSSTSETTTLSSKPATGQVYTFTPPVVVPPSDYRSTQSGNWNTASTWERNDGGSWIPAETWPDSDDYTITVRSGHTVTVGSDITVDEVTIDAGGVVETTGAAILTLNDGTGTDMTVNGTFVRSSSAAVVFSASASMSIGSAGKYTHNINGGSIPSSSNIIWDNNSILEITGITSSTSITNFGGQTYGNLIWNCASQTSTFSIGNAITVNGDLTITSSGSGSLTFSTYIVTLYGDFISNGGTLTASSGGELKFSAASGTQNFSQAGAITGSLKITKNAAGTLLLNTDANWPSTTSVTAGILDFGAIAHTLTLATGLTVDFTGSTVLMNGGNAAHRLYFTGASPTITGLSSITHGNDDTVEFGITGTVSLNQSITLTHLKISGSGSVRIVSAGGPYTITCNGDYIQTNGTFSLNAGVAGLMGILDLTSGNFYLNGGTFTASASTQYGELRFTKSGTQDYTQTGTISGRGVRINIGANATLALQSDATWTGDLITVAGTLLFGSTLRTVNITNTSVADVLQGSGILDMQNDAHILNYSSSSILFNGTLSAGTSSFFKYVGGTQAVKVLPYCNLNIEGGSLTKTLDGATTCTGNLYIGSGTTLSLGTSGTTTLTVNGSAAIDGTFTFSNTAAKTVTIGGDLSGAGTITMQTAGLAHTLNLGGAANAIATFNTTAGSGSTVNYNRSGDQSVFGSANYINIAISNGGGKTLSGSSTVSSNINLNSGLFVLGNNNLTLSSTSGLINGTPSSSNMIVTDGSGQLIKTFATGNTAAFTFPVGDNTGTAEYSPVTIDFSACAVSGTVGLNVVNARHPADVASTYLSRYWQFSTSGLTTYSYTAVYNYMDADVTGTESDLKISGYNNSNSTWTEYLTSTVNTGANTLTTPAFDNTTGTLNNNDYTGKREDNMVYSSSTTTQTTVTNVAKPANDQEIIGVQIVTSGGPANPISVTSFTFNTNGSTNAAVDITNADLWYSGTSSSFSTATLFGSSASPNGSFIINGSQTLALGANYFWLTYDIPGSATNGDFVDAECNSITVGSARTPTVQAPGGNRVIGTYATLPYYQSFDGTWSDKGGTRDVPDGFWISNYDATDVDSWWRRNDDGASAGWTSPGSGSFTPYSGNAARFHTYNTSSPKKGSLDLYVDLSPSGTKRLYFRYYNSSGTDQLIVKLSQDGGSTFPTTLTPVPSGSPLGTASSWVTQTVDLSSYSNSTSVIRFEATSDYGTTDIGLDEVRVQVLADPTYATLPYSQNFDGTWADRGPGDCNSIPDVSWKNTPEMYNNSWRRQDEGAKADWSSSGTGTRTPFDGSAGCADFHSYLTSTYGTLDLYVDLTPAGTKQLLFKYINPSGTDNLVVQLSSNGGSTFPVTLGTLNTQTDWQTVVYDISAYTNATSVIRFKATGDNGASDIGIDDVRLAVIPAPTYATVPYCQTFEGTWLDRSTFEDVPDNSWVVSPATGNNSWRKHNRGTTADWGSSGSGLVTPNGSSGAADFHSYLTTGVGTMDLYLDLNTSGTKILTYTYLNTSGTDQMEILFSTNNGSSFTSKVVRTTQSLTCVPSWVTQTVDLGTTTSSTCVLRFKATGDNGATDIGLDNVCISILPDPVYATIPFIENFESSWTNRLGVKDIPNTSWTTNPSWGNNSWRRQNEGCTSDWGSSSSGIVSPNGSTGAANFHSYLTTGTGDLDLYIDMSTPGSKLLTFNYLNVSGTDNLKVYLSTNGGSTFTQKSTLTNLSQLDAEPKDCNNNWLKIAVDLGTTTSSTCVVRFRATGDNGSNDIGIDNISIVIPPAPVYASLPYTQGFENSWVDRYGYNDVPDNSWVNSPYMGANSWRKQNEGCSGDWGSASSGLYTAASGTGYADFHSYLTTGIGYLDLYVDMSTAGFKRLSFDYKNTSGSDQLQVQFSSTGSKAFTTLLTVGSGYNWQTLNVDFDNTVSSTCVIRFKATGDNGSNDIGIDNINLRVVTDIYPMNNTDVETCSGIFFDSGGSLTNYGNSESFTKTFSPDPGSSIVVNFTSFNTYNASDHLHIYDTTVAGFNEIPGSPFSGSNSPGSITATNYSGALTFVWTSDGSNTAAGWKADIACRPGCSANPPLGEYCENAVPICNLNGYCGNTTTYGPEHSPSNPVDEDSHAGVNSVWSPWTIENNGWLTFIAEATSISIDVYVNNCTDGKGIQIGVFSTADCETFTRMGSVWSPAVEQDQMGLTFPGLTIGNKYYMLIDGYAGDHCEYTIGQADGMLVPDAGPDQTITLPDCADLLASGGTGYSWSSGAGTAATTVCPAVTTTYTVTVTGGSSICPASGTDEVTIFVNGSLPVVLLDFSTSCEGNEVLLEWKTASEDRNDYFTIERSTDGVYWFFVDKVKGSGNTNDLREYKYTDIMVNNGDVYYRLSQTDYDGNSDYLDIDKLDCKNTDHVNASIISITEAYAQGGIVMVLYTPDAEKEITIEVYDSRGRQLVSKKISTEEGQNIITLNDFTVSSGVYLFNVLGSNYRLSEKTIIK